MSTAARFVTLEGIEGVGKSTQVARLSAALRDKGVAHVVTREPGGTALAERIREVVLTAREEALPPIAELLLMFAARAVHLKNHVEPNLRAGRCMLTKGAAAVCRSSRSVHWKSWFKARCVPT
jgi:dTMP kinase